MIKELKNPSLDKEIGVLVENNKPVTTIEEPKEPESDFLELGTTFMVFGKEYIVTYVNKGKKRMTIEPYKPGR
jgi:hypothetical protein